MTSTGSWDWAPYAGDRWTPESIGDKVKGKVVDIQLTEGRQGPYPVVTVQIDEAGNWREIHPPTDLKRKFADANVQIGDWVSAELVELKHTGQPSPMKIFKVATKPGDAPSPAPVVDDVDLTEFEDDVF